eukprot:PhF_6_TR4550/c0_g1_i2/m.6422
MSLRRVAVIVIVFVLFQIVLQGHWTKLHQPPTASYRFHAHQMSSFKAPLTIAATPVSGDTDDDGGVYIDEEPTPEPPVAPYHSQHPVVIDIQNSPPLKL